MEIHYKNVELSQFWRYLCQSEKKMASFFLIKLKAEELLKKRPDVQAVVSADKDVSHGKVVAVIDAVKGAGVKKFAITIDKKK